jgi:predicted amidophosphoribosyltransferase
VSATYVDLDTGIAYEMDEIDLPAAVTRYRPLQDGDRSCSCCGRWVPLWASGVCSRCGAECDGMKKSWHRPGAQQ